jgi:hypothetical protein
MAAISQRAYARHRRVALSAVQKAVETGRISTLADGTIDPEVADREWAERSRAYTRGQDEEDSGAFGASQYSKARAVREHYMARLAKLDYEQKVGSLVPKAEVQIAAFNERRRFRDHMLNIPDRVAAMLAAETDATRCYDILQVEIRKALNEYSDSDN